MIQYANLMVYFFVYQLTQCLLCCNDSVFIVFDSVDDVIICNTSLNNIIKLLHLTSSAAVYYIFQPFKIIFFK